jgi:quinol monooxygenase YgiN
MNQPIHVVGLAEYLPERETEVLAILRKLAEQTRREPGCLRYDVYRDTKNALQLHLIAVFIDDVAIQRHVEAPYRNAALAALEGKIAGSMAMSVLRPVDDSTGV